MKTKNIPAQKTSISDTTELVSLLFSFSRVMRDKLSTPYCTKANQKDKTSISLLHIKTLSAVAEQKITSMRDIADMLHISSPSATVLIQKLFKESYLRRLPDKTDRRIVRLVLTKKGEHILKQKKDEASESLRELLSLLKDPDKKELARILSIILEK